LPVVPPALLLKVLLLLLRSLLTLSRAAAAAAAGRGGLGLALPANAAAGAVAVGLTAPLLLPLLRWARERGGGLARGLLPFLPPAPAEEELLLLLLLNAPLLLLFRMGEDEAGLLLPLPLLLPGLLLAGVGGALLGPPLEVLLLPACWPSSESPSSEATDTVLLGFCLMLHKVCKREEDLQGCKQEKEDEGQQQHARECRKAVQIVRGFAMANAARAAGTCSQRPLQT
jgi:hypothetical protein